MSLMDDIFARVEGRAKADGVSPTAPYGRAESPRVGSSVPTMDDIFARVEGRAPIGNEPIKVEPTEPLRMEEIFRRVESRGAAPSPIAEPVPVSRLPGVMPADQLQIPPPGLLERAAVAGDALSQSAGPAYAAMAGKDPGLLAARAIVGSGVGIGEDPGLGAHRAAMATGVGVGYDPGVAAAIPAAAAAVRSGLGQDPGLGFARVAQERLAARYGAGDPGLQAMKELYLRRGGVDPAIAQAVEVAGSPVARGIIEAGKALNETLAEVPAELGRHAENAEKAAEVAAPFFRALGGLMEAWEEQHKAAARAPLPPEAERTGKETILDDVLEAAPAMALMMGSGAMGPQASLGVAFALEYGNASLRARREGATDQERKAAALVSGGVSSFLERYGISKIMSKVFGGIPDKTILDFGRNVLVAALAEGGTEISQDVAQDITAAAVYAGEQGLSAEEFTGLFSLENLRQWGRSGLVGFLMGVGIAGAGRYLAGPSPDQPPRGDRHHVPRGVYSRIPVEQGPPVVEQQAPPRPKTPPPASEAEAGPATGPARVAQEPPPAQEAPGGAQEAGEVDLSRFEYTPPPEGETPPVAQEVPREAGASLASAEFASVEKERQAFKEWILERAKWHLDNKSVATGDFHAGLKRVSEEIRAGMVPAHLQEAVYRHLRGTFQPEEGDFVDIDHPEWPRTHTLVEFLEGDEQRQIERDTAELAQEAPLPEVPALGDLSAINIKDPALKKWYLQKVRDMHPDTGADAERDRRTRFLQEFNNAAERQDGATMRSIWEAFERGDDLPPVSSGRRYRPPSPPSRPQPQPPPAAQQQQQQRPPPEPPPGPPPQRGPAQQHPEKSSFILPELLEFFEKASGQNRLPVVIQQMLGRHANKLGYVDPNEPLAERVVRISNLLATDPAEAARIIGHEIGHWIDMIPHDDIGRTIKRTFRGAPMNVTVRNLLGRIASINRYTKSWVDEIPANPSRVFSEAELKAFKQAAVAQARQQLPKGYTQQDLKNRSQTIMNQTIATEMANRGLVDAKTINDELWNLSQKWRPLSPAAQQNPEHLAYRQETEEIYADFFSAIMMDPATARREAPNATNLFFNHLKQKPDVLRAYEETQLIAAQDRSTRLQHVAERVQAMMEAGGRRRAIQMIEAAQKSKAHSLTLSESLAKTLIDEASVWYKNLRQHLKSGGKIDPNRDPTLWLEEASYMSSRIAAYLDRVSENVIYPLREKIGDAEIGRLLLLRSASQDPDQLQKFQALGVQGEIAIEVQQEIEKLHGKDVLELFKKTMANWWTYRQGVMDRLEEARVLDAKTLKRIRDKPLYVRRTLQEYIDSRLKNDGGISFDDAFHQQLGSVQPIGNPLIETILVDIAMLRFAHRNATRLAAIEQLVRSGEAEAIAEVDRGAGGVVLPPKDRHYTIVRYRRDGKSGAVYMLKKFAEPMERDRTWSKGLEVWDRWGHQPLRHALTDWNPAWILWNAMRDMQRFQRNVARGVFAGDPIGSWVQTIRYMARAAPDAFKLAFKGQMTEDVRAAFDELAFLTPGQHSYAESILDDNSKAAFDLLTQRFNVYGDPLAKGGFAEFRRRLADALSTPGEFSERLTKIAGYKYLKEQRPELSARERARQVRNRVGTPNAYRRGSYGRGLNYVFLFSNIGKEGWRGDYEAFKDSPLDYSVKLAANVVGAAVVTMAAAKGLLGEEYEEIINKVPEHDRRGYLIVPWGLDTKGRAVYSRIPLDHVSQVLMQLMWAVHYGDEKTADFARTLADASPWSPSAMHPALETMFAGHQYAMGHNPPDFYFGTDVIDRDTYKSDAYGKDALRQFIGWAISNAGGRVVGGPQTWDSLLGRVPFLAGPGRKSDGLDLRDPTWWDGLHSIPVLGPFLGSFVKVSDRGEQEMSIKERAKMSSDDATQHLGRDKEIYDFLEGRLSELRRAPDGVPTRQMAIELHRTMPEELRYRSVRTLHDRMRKIALRYSGDAKKKAKSYE